MHSEGDKAICRCGSLVSPTPFSMRKNKTGEEEKKRQCNGNCMKQKKEKCSGVTCPLPMSHTAPSPLVGGAPRQDASTWPISDVSRPRMQIVSGEFFVWWGLDRASAGGGESIEVQPEGHTSNCMKDDKQVSPA